MQPTILHRAAVLGSPIAHSLSPVIHNAAYRFLGLEQWQYTACDVREDQLADFIASLDSSWAGLSLTMPLKQTIMDMGEPKNAWAEKLGVGNTAIFTWVPGSAKPRIAIYNTDVAGIYMALQHAQESHATAQSISNPAAAQTLPRQTHRRALVIGSGNTAHSAIAALSTMHCSAVTLAARSVNKAYALAPLAQNLGMDTDVIALAQVIPALLDRQYDVIISTLPPHAADSLAQELQAQCAESTTARHAARHAAPTPDQHWGTLLDVAYAPHPTALVSAWTNLGGSAVGGEEMLLYQALPQISYMTGIAFENDSNTDSNSNTVLALTEYIRQELGRVLQ